MTDELFDLLTYELGEIGCWEEECPGVYYLSVLPTIGAGGEYYAILEEAPISQELRAMGQKLEDTPVLIYWAGAEDGSHTVLEYEVLRYKIINGIPLPEGASLREIALSGAEVCPSYFGTYPVPPSTPWGHTLRHRSLVNGLYWMETERCIEVLAVCYPIWDGELPEELLTLGRKMDARDEMGYIFFLRDAACVVIWELLRTRPALITTGLIRKPELMNAIWAHRPEYALGYNAQEQAGLNDTLGLLLYALGVEDRELESSPKHMVSITPDVGTNFIGFWR